MQHDLMVEASDGEAIPVSIVHPSTPPLGWIHLAHGMGEHRRRYETLPHRLVAAGTACRFMTITVMVRVLPPWVIWS